MDANKTYNFQSLEHFFKDEVSPEVITKHLEVLLQFLVFYSENIEQKALGLYEVYSDILELKQILQELQKDNG